MIVALIGIGCFFGVIFGDVLLFKVIEKIFPLQEPDTISSIKVGVSFLWSMFLSSVVVHFCDAPWWVLLALNGFILYYELEQK